MAAVRGRRDVAPRAGVKPTTSSSEEVRFRSGEVTLAGTFVASSDAGGAALILTGSGRLDRDSNGRGFRGRISPAIAGGDACAAIGWLAGRCPGLPLYAVGHSEGALHVAHLAAEDKVAGAVLIACPARTGGDPDVAGRADRPDASGSSEGDPQGSGTRDQRWPRHASSTRGRRCDREPRRGAVRTSGVRGPQSHPPPGPRLKGATCLSEGAPRARGARRS